jgi:signal transduction histidine kinase
MRLPRFPRAGTDVPLWLWMGLRMSVLAIVAVLAVAAGMAAYFELRDRAILDGLPPEVRREMEQLREHPRENQARLWALMQRHYDIEVLLPGLSNPDWMMLGPLLACELPFVVFFGVLASRPLSRQFALVARAARRVAGGDFRVRARLRGTPPRELAALALDFNDMTARLEQYERELRESSAMLAHELRTPLNAAMGRVQGMLDDVFPRDEAQLQLVNRQLEQINRLVGDLHLLSLARAGQLRLELEPFGLRELVVERLAWVESKLAQAGIVPSVAVPADLRVHADRDRVGQVLSVLIDNVVRYAPGGRAIDIAASHKGEAIELVVADRGAGVSEADLPRLSDRFWRADESRARNSGGTGLGLAIAAAICEAHGGALRFEPAPGGGLRAIVRLVDRKA